MEAPRQPRNRVHSRRDAARAAGVLGTLVVVLMTPGCGSPPDHAPAAPAASSSSGIEAGEVWVEPGPREPVDGDGDGLHDGEDNCPVVSNPRQDDYDRDGVGDTCDACPERWGSRSYGCPGEIGPPSDMTRAEWRVHFAGTDWDGDGISLPHDLCPTVGSSDQGDRDGDGWGDACDRCADVPAPRSAGGCPYGGVWGAEVAIATDPVRFCRQTCDAIFACPLLVAAYDRRMRDPMERLCGLICENQPTDRYQLIEAGRDAQLYASGCEVPRSLYSLLQVDQFAACEQTYCFKFLERCGADPSFEDEATCIEVCRNWPLGERGDTTGHSIACRAHYAQRAQGRELAAYCEAASSSGGDLCTQPVDQRSP